MVRQYSPLVHESKYYPNVRTALLYTHASGPFLPSSPSPFASSGSRLQFFIDPTCTRKGSEVDVAVEITVDLWATLGSLVVRYRMAAVAFPFSIVMLVVGRQLHEYNAGSRSSTFPTSILHTISVLLISASLPSFLCNRIVHRLRTSAHSLHQRYSPPSPRNAHRCFARAVYHSCYPSCSLHSRVRSSLPNLAHAQLGIGSSFGEHQRVVSLLGSVRGLRLPRSSGSRVYDSARIGGWSSMARQVVPSSWSQNVSIFLACVRLFASFN